MISVKRRRALDAQKVKRDEMEAAKQEGICRCGSQGVSPRWWDKLVPSGDANKIPPHCGRFGTTKIKLKPKPKIYRQREYQVQGDCPELMKRLMMEFLERGCVEPSDNPLKICG